MFEDWPIRPETSLTFLHDQTKWLGCLFTIKSVQKEDAQGRPPVALCLIMSWYVSSSDDELMRVAPKS